MNQLKKPLLMITGLVICLCMLRLGIWQLERGEQKQVVLEQMVARSEIPAVSLVSLVEQLQKGDRDRLRFRQVSVTGQYAPEKSIYLDNKVVNSSIGYAVLTPFRLQDTDWWVLVDRGWIGVGATRAELPVFKTDKRSMTLGGRLMSPAAQPPLWNDRYAVAIGALWQYLPIDDYATQMQLKVLPLVLELAPDQATEIESALIRDLPQIEDHWVAKHNAYAFQWFALAIAFFIACLVLTIRTL